MSVEPGQAFQIIPPHLSSTTLTQDMGADCADSTTPVLVLGVSSQPSARARGQGMGAYAAVARRRVHLATVLPRPPSGHCLGRRQARHTPISKIGLHLTQQ